MLIVKEFEKLSLLLATGFVFTCNGEKTKIELKEGWMVHRLLPALYDKMYKV